MPYRKPIAFTPDWLKVAEAAAVLDCHPHTVLNRIKAGVLPVRTMHFGRVLRMNKKDFETYLDRQSMASQST